MPKQQQRSPFSMVIPDRRPGNDPEHDLRELPLDQITPNVAQFRQTFNSDTIRELADSIAEQGLIEPLVVRPKDGAFEVVAGERRRRALGLLADEGRGLAGIPCIIRELDDAAAAMIIAAENLQREDLSIADEAVMYERLIDVLGLGERGGRELARRLGISPSRVQRARALADHPVTLQAVVDGTLTLRNAMAQISLRAEVAELETEQMIYGKSISTEIENSEPNQAPLFSEQHVREHTRKVPAAAWRPFYRASDVASEVVPPLPPSPEDRQEIIKRALMLREWADNVLRAAEAMPIDSQADQE